MALTTSFHATCRFLGRAEHERITCLLKIADTRRKTDLLEEACATVIDEPCRQEPSDVDSDFLLDHGPVVNEKIQDLQPKTLFASMR